VQQLAAYHDEIGQMFMQKCEDLSEIGVQFTELGDFTLNFDNDDQKRLEEAQGRYADLKVKRRAKDELGGGNYMNYAAGEAMLGAGQGMAKGGEGGGAMQGGAGLGMGFAMAQMFANNVQQGGQPQQGHPQQPPQQQAGGNVACPACNATVPAGRFCAECGASLAPPAPKPCPSCSTVCPPGAKFCANCGTKMA
jgi:membrane protease subunit (stomatin/prohibitin family)